MLLIMSAYVSVCVSVCDTVTFESLEREGYFWFAGAFLEYLVKFACQGHWLKDKVTVYAVCG